MKITGYIHAEYNEWEKKYVFKVWSMDMSSTPHCGPLVSTCDIEFEAPPHEVLVSGTIEKYREMQKQILAESEKRRSELEQKINELLCIEYRPDTGTD